MHCVGIIPLIYMLVPMNALAEVSNFIFHEVIHRAKGKESWVMHLAKS